VFDTFFLTPVDILPKLGENKKQSTVSSRGYSGSRLLSGHRPDKEAGG